MTLRPSNAPWRQSLASRLPWIVAATLYVVILYRTAWVGDDAFITLRSIDNFVHGYGLRWNVAERVQVFTHPLWMLLWLAVYSVTREPFYTVIAMSLVLSLTTFLVLQRVSQRTDYLAPLLATVLAFSRCYVDYSTSGLENPLSHLLAALFCWSVLPAYRANDPARRLRNAALIAGLAVVNREDHLLIYLPVLIWLVARSELGRVKVAWRLALGALPTLLWTGFSLVYYGFPFPNTAYAKLNVDIPRLTLLRRGLLYVVDFGRNDPVSALVIVVMFVVVGRFGRPLERALLSGVALYVIYVASIGGDFMSGRFFSTPLLVSVILLMVRAPEVRLLPQVAILLTTLGLSLVPKHRLWSTEEVSLGKHALSQGIGVVDERLYYFRHASLLYDNPSESVRPWHPRVFEGLRLKPSGKQVIVRGAVGYFGYFVGVDVHIIDFWALCDPLLARIPFRPTGKWRMGHFARKLPLGYEAAVGAGNAKLIQEPTLSNVYADILLATRAPLFDKGRWAAILRLNNGHYTQALTTLRY